MHVRSWRAGYRGLLPDEVLDALSVERRERDWSARMAMDAAGRTLVAEHDGAVVGFASLFGSDLAALYVDPDHWRRGFGGALLREVIAIAPGDLTLWVMADNVAARRFYERHGFAPDGSEKREPVGPPEARAETLQVRLRRRA